MLLQKLNRSLPLFVSHHRYSTTTNRYLKTITVPYIHTRAKSYYHPKTESEILEEIYAQEPAYPFDEPVEPDEEFDPYDEYMPGFDSAEGFFNGRDAPKWLDRMENVPLEHKISFRDGEVYQKVKPGYEANIID